ncbi:MAG: secondary thiamine-phosphate synthase enzyme YjbQ [Caldiserica bacterium]|nr:secondary thiamine-phosphate synthase enzyme YjbQ [Caldisericota bacterium]
MQILEIETTSHTEMIDITAEIAAAISKNNVKSGVCTIFVPHTTAGVTLNENADPSVRKDFINVFEKLIPKYERYSHAEGNAPAHIKSSIFGSSLNIIIEDGKPVLGTWQGIFFCEFDGPRNRKIYLQIMTT